MKIITLGAFGALLASTAMAEEIILRADVTAATVFTNGTAEVAREVVVAVPAGAHELVLLLPQGTELTAPIISAVGALGTGAFTIEHGFTIEEGAYDRPEEAAARAAVEALEAEIEAVVGDMTVAQSAIEAAAIQRQYLQGLTNGEGAAPSDPAALAAMLSTLSAEMLRISDEARLADQRLTELQEQADDLREELGHAQRALADLRPLGPNVTALRLPVRAESQSEATFTLSHLAHGAYWQPSYRVDLDQQAEVVSIARDMVFQLGGNEVWRDISLSLSTAQPNRDREPAALNPSPVRVYDPQNRAVYGGFADAAVVSSPYQAAEGLLAARPVGFDEETMPMVEMTGYAFTYRFPDAATLVPGVENQQPMAPITLPIELETRAVPRWNDTAFLMAQLDNESGELLLPGRAVFMRDGEMLGEGHMPMLAPGVTAEIGFGALDHLQLEWRELALNEGSGGVFSRSDTQDRAFEFSVENLSDESQSLRMLYAVPFSEQDELDLDVTLSEMPDALDVDDLRGVSAWDLVLEPSETRVIRMDVEASWPEGQMIDWRP